MPPTPNEMQTEEYRAKQARCRGMLIFWDTPANMGVAIGQTLVFFFVAASLITYLTSLALEPGASFLKVFHFTCTAGLLTHCAGLFPGVFWFKRRLAMDLLDKAIFALATGNCFAWLSPAA